jgi:hypothetical protein
MANYVDIAETYFAAGDFDGRKRYLRTRNGGGSLAVCSGVTWRLGDARPNGSELGPYRTWRWRLGSIASLNFSVNAQSASNPTPQRVTSCLI